MKKQINELEIPTECSKIQTSKRMKRCPSPSDVVLGLYGNAKKAKPSKMLFAKQLKNWNVGGGGKDKQYKINRCSNILLKLESESQTESPRAEVWSIVCL